MMKRKQIQLTVAILLIANLLIVPQVAIGANNGALSAPVLTSVTRQTLSDGSPGDEATMLWQPSSGPVFDYAIYANGRFIFRTGAADTTRGILFLTSEGLDGSETITVRAEGGVDPQGNPTSQSPDSNGLTAVPAVELQPTPALTSAAIDRAAGTVTLTWTPTQTHEISGHVIYYVYATPVVDFGTVLVTSVEDATTVTASLRVHDLVTLSGNEEFYLVARDRTYFNASRPSNRLVPTGR